MRSIYLNPQAWFVNLLLLVNTVNAASCQPFNHVYPAPRDVTSGSITSTRDRLAMTLTQMLNNETIQSVTNTTSVSIDVYSIHNLDPMFTFHHTAPSLATTTEGVTTVTSDTVYRVASISKAWTVYISLLAAGDDAFNDPITKYVPELADYAASHDEDNRLNVIDWNSVTVGSLASQLSGTGRDIAFGPQTDLVYQQLLGLPPPIANLPNTSFCSDPLTYSLAQFPCNRSAFFDTNLFRPPILAPFSSPIYANTPYQILAYAIENITNTSFPDLFQTYLVDALNLTSTFYSAPPSTNNSIIPVNASASLYNIDFLDGAPYGGYYSSTHDISAVGRSILNSTLLSPAQTRKWLKPVDFLPPGPLLTDDGIMQAIGAPWEIIRAPAPSSTFLGAASCDVCNATTNSTAARKYQTWIYTKAGDLGMYSSLTALMPEFDVGFTILAAGTDPRIPVLNAADMITEMFVPALFEAARTETNVAYAGTFVDGNTNSSVVLEIPDAHEESQGLRVTEWRYNGTDFVQRLSATLFGLPEGSELEVRVYPDGLTSDVNDGGEFEEGWRAAFSMPGDTPAAGAFSSTCWGWSAIGGLSYGGIAFDDFRLRMQVGDDGARRAVGLNLPALQVNLTRAV